MQCGLVVFILSNIFGDGEVSMPPRFFKHV